MRVLICDDTDVIRAIIRKHVEAEGHEVVAECASGMETVEVYPSVKPDVCLIDVAMPGFDGIQTLKKLKEIDPGVVAVFVTARDDQQTMIDGIQAGAIDYIEKPFTRERLRAALLKI